MSQYSQAQNAYSTTARQTTSDPRSIEYQIFSKVTGRLLKANANREKNFSEFAEALYDNTHLWTTLAADILSDGNQLDDALKVQLLNLANYSQQHAHKALKTDIGADALISINNTIMRGLRGEVDTESVSASETDTHKKGA
jgi:flagellar biosynthesis activator protein FlaF